MIFSALDPKSGAFSCKKEPPVQEWARGTTKKQTACGINLRISSEKPESDDRGQHQQDNYHADHPDQKRFEAVISHLSHKLLAGFKIRLRSGLLSPNLPLL